MRKKGKKPEVRSQESGESSQEGLMQGMGAELIKDLRLGI